MSVALVFPFLAVLQLGSGGGGGGGGVGKIDRSVDIVYE